MIGVRVEIKHFSWSWDELPDEEGAAFAEQWTYDDDGSLQERKRIPLGNQARTMSTDPRARAIMAEELGQRDKLGTMGAPAWTREG